MTKQTHMHTILIRPDTQAKCWLAMFLMGGDMPQGEWIPLPFTPAAAPGNVAADLLRRFPMAEVKTATAIYRRARRMGWRDHANCLNAVAAALGV